MLNLTEPQYVMPIHGDHKRLFLHGKLAESVGVPSEAIFRGRNGRRRHSDGSGLGLAIVRHIAEAHGGSVALSSSPEGTVVRVELPLANL